MDFINKVTIQGAVGSIHRSTISDNTLARISVAVNSVIYKANNAIIETAWLEVTAWGNNKDIADLSQINKGDCIKVEGRLKQDRYTTAEGENRSIITILANKLSKV